MLQNRVDPFGNIIKTAARGTLMGNRGLLHNNKKEILRPYKLNTWITCVLEFKERKRQVMSPGQYTELFFMDEATSFAAGHRPCFECRKEEANKFKSCWLKGNPGYGFNANTLIKEIDNIIHKERISGDKLKISYEENPYNLPNGAFVIFKNEPYLVNDGAMYLWAPFGYGKAIKLPNIDHMAVLTPKSIIHTFSAGYTPQMAI